VHCTRNSEHRFLLKLLGLVPNFYIHLSGIDLYIPTISLILNLYIPVLRERTLGSTTEAERRTGNCCQAVVGGSSLPLLSVPVVELGVHINYQHTNFQFEKL